ncbi:MAG: hypothetical protein WCH44_03295 [Betaproteobacteria bacterium]
MNVCAAGNSTLLGYANQQLQLFFGQIFRMPSANCASQLTRDFDMMMIRVEVQRTACLAAAEKG